MVRNSFLKSINGSSILITGLLLTVFSFLLTGCFDDNIDATVQERDLALQKQLGVDTLLIKQYLADNNITDAKKTAGLIWYTEQTVGTGIQPQAGSRVKVNYALSLLDSTAIEDGPLGPFTLGTGSVIDGFDLAIRTMKVGGKSRFYIPSILAYADTGSGSIEPNTVLVFDIELLEAL
ncbi:MAG: hypothetical protein COW65_16665 [Cytophagales bacterium CG18_big_fil_WC_8_21_14_2_50_42_9]|nr:MAG: hypothetical protein COW65_16665 [Cytophagales bacterium CG18_big_fil_WC_8_21_14_2_50_42_9]